MRRAVAVLALLGVVACSDASGAPDASPAPTSEVAATTASPSVTTAPPPTTPATTTPTTTSPTTSSTTTTTPPPPTTVPAPAGYPAQPDGVAFPTADWAVAELPVDRAPIDAVVDAAFGAADADARVRSVIVVHGGQIVYERYHPRDGPDVVYESWSVGKSITSALIGLLVADGRIALDDPVLRPEWQAPGDPRQAITMRQLLQMSGGLEWEESATPGGPLGYDLFEAEDVAAVMAAQPLERPPGSDFEYSTGTTALIAGIAADLLGGCQETIDLLDDRLLDPIGITSEELTTDGRGCFIGGYGANMTTRDFARFGLLYLRGGWWDGRQLLPSSWIDETRVPAATNASYGLQWWLDDDGQAFSALGLFGQVVFVDPARDLVIAINTAPGGDPGPVVDAVRAAFPPS